MQEQNQTQQPQDVQQGQPNGSPQQVTAAKALWQGFLHGMDTTTRGLTIPASKAMMKIAGQDPSTVDLDNAESDKEYQQIKQQHNVAASIGSFLGGTAVAIPTAAAATALLPEAATGALGTAAGMALKGAAQGGAIGALMDPGQNGYAKNIALGAGTVGGLGAGLGKILSPYVSDEAQALGQSAKNIGMPVSLNDLGSASDAMLPKLISTATKYIPFSGFSSIKTQQQEALEGSIKNFISQVGAGSDGSEQSIADAISNKAAQMKSMAGDMFDQVSKSASDAGMGNISLDKTSQFINGLSDDTTNNTVIKRLLNQVPDNNSMSFDDLRSLRSMSGKQYTQLSRQVANGTASPEDLQALQGIRSNIDADMDKWGLDSNNPQVVKDYAAARSFYQNYAQIFKTPQMTKALGDDAQMYTMIGKLAGEKNPFKEGDIMDALGDENAPMAKAYVIQNALTNSLKNTPAGQKIDLDSFINTLNKPSGDAQQVVWGDQYDKLQGFKNLMTVLQPKLSQQTGNPIQGAMNMVAQHSGAEAGALGAGAVALGHGAAAAGAAPYIVGAGALSRVFNSPAMADILTRMASVGPSTPQSIVSSLSLQGARGIRSVLQKPPITLDEPSSTNN